MIGGRPCWDPGVGREVRTILSMSNLEKHLEGGGRERIESERRGEEGAEDEQAGGREGVEG